MNVKTIADYKTIESFHRSEGDESIPLELFSQLLQKAEKLHMENQRLYDKFLDIQEIMEEVREEAKPI